MLKLTLCFLLLMLVRPIYANESQALHQLAVDHLEKVRGRSELDWSNYQISSSTSEKMKTWLEDRILDFRKNHLKSYYEFKVSDSRFDKDIAMLIVEVSNSTDPYFYKVFSLALCKTGEDWKVAPMVGSYRFTGDRFYSEVDVTRRKYLEEWATKRTVALAENGLSDRLQSVKDSLSKYHKEDSALLGDSQELAALYFIEACRRKDLLAMLACLAEDDRHGRVAIIEAMRKSQNIGAWKTLLGKNYLFSPLPILKKHSAIVSVGIFSPKLSKRELIIELTTKRLGKRWCVTLPKSLLLKEGDEVKFNEFYSYNLKSENRKRANSVKSLIAESLVSSGSSSSDDLLLLLTSSLEDLDISTYFGLLKWDGFGEVTDGERKNKLLAFEKALKSWRQFDLGSNVRFNVVYTHDSEQNSIAGILAYQATRPWDHKIHPIFLYEDQEQWFIHHNSDLRKLEVQKVITVEQNRRFGEFTKNRGATALGSILPNLLEFKSSGRLSVSDEMKVRAKDVYQRYSDSLKEVDLVKVSSVLSVESEGGMGLLCALGHEIRQYASKKSEFTLVEAVSSTSIIGLVVSEKSTDDSGTNYRLYPLVNFEPGLKILPQCVYRYEFFRGQKLLNQDTLLDLENRFDVGFLAERDELVEKFNTKVTELLKKEDE